eukprot:TRINITY_DN10413_c0_g1_i1.p1 TRINITY_DN10413_c0_g1~~TRINITY_DN10413_c0_g1_i1.p1  ORF type:complete len:198 (-),score=30.56 TRINITY_DN10413_c0_g1_i1:163-756(-)
MAVGQRLGGGQGLHQPPLGREERLQRLLASEAFGGAPVADDAAYIPPDVRQQPKKQKPPTAPGAPVRPASASRAQAPTSAAASRGGVAQPPRPAPPRRPSSASAVTGRRQGANVHTINSGSSCGGSRLHNTTEAYRQHRGTTAKTVEQVGRGTMTKEKAAEVDRARAIVHGKGAAKPPGERRAASASCGPGRRLGGS